MSIDPADISFVIQGGLDATTDVAANARSLRNLFPGCTVLLSTQSNAVGTFKDHAAFDEVVLSDDPGSLPSVKTEGGPNNVNRQIGSSRAGLARVTTPYAAKLRTDATLGSRRIAEIWEELGHESLGPKCVGKSRILVGSIFSVNPRFDERVPYHISDWIQFGRTEDLRSFWSCPLFQPADATWYETRPHAEGSLPREAEFRSRYGTEQWLTLNYLFKGDFPIAFHNDQSAGIVDDFEEYLADNFIIVHPDDIDLSLSKHANMYRNRYFNAICYSFEDWKKVVSARRGVTTKRSGHVMWPYTFESKRMYVALRRRFLWLKPFLPPGLIRRPAGRRWPA